MATQIKRLSTEQSSYNIVYRYHEIHMCIRVQQSKAFNIISIAVIHLIVSLFFTKLPSNIDVFQSCCSADKAACM